MVVKGSDRDMSSGSLFTKFKYIMCKYSKAIYNCCYQAAIPVTLCLNELSSWIRNMLNANQIKVRLIDFLLSDETSLIASEVSFYQGYRKADLVQVIGEQVIAYEIKSDRDQLATLEEQLLDYSNTFSFCYLVTTQKHIKSARQMCPDRTGLILMTEGGLKVIRRPKENKRLCKHSLTLGLSESVLETLTQQTKDLNYAHQKRAYLERELNLNYLKRYFYETLLEKYNHKYQKFLLDRGMRTTLTDLYYLQSA